MQCIKACIFECYKYNNSHQIFPSSAEVLVIHSYQYLFYALLPIYTIIPDMPCILVSVYPSIFIATLVTCDIPPLNPHWRDDMYVHVHHILYMCMAVFALALYQQGAGPLLTIILKPSFS